MEARQLTEQRTKREGTDRYLYQFADPDTGSGIGFSGSYLLVYLVCSPPWSR